MKTINKGIAMSTDSKTTEEIGASFLSDEKFAGLMECILNNGMLVEILDECSRYSNMFDAPVELGISYHDKISGYNERIHIMNKSEKLYTDDVYEIFFDSEETKKLIWYFCNLGLLEDILEMCTNYIKFNRHFHKVSKLK